MIFALDETVKERKTIRDGIIRAPKKNDAGNFSAKKPPFRSPFQIQ